MPLEAFFLLAVIWNLIYYNVVCKYIEKWQNIPKELWKISEDVKERVFIDDEIDTKVI